MQENERKVIREKLETESIRASILRHDLKVLPGKIQEEIRGMCPIRFQNFKYIIYHYQ